MLSRRLFVLSGLAVGACAQPQSKANVLTVAATAVPHAEILKAIQPDLAGQGIDLQIKVFNDYVQPNLQVDQKLIDANYFQTLPYLDAFNAERGTRLVPVVGVHVEPFGAYSRKVKTIAGLKPGAVIAVPNDPTNTGRALILLHKNGVITLKDPGNIAATPKDIVANPKGFVFKELESPSLPRVLGEVDLALINTNYALDAKLDPQKDALIIEGPDSPYLNYLVAREDNKADPRIAALAVALTSQKVRDFIAATYQGAVIAAKA
ncbi:MetQ/NlpA family ABC transporter substrate-binding protein [Asticcacaulis sp. AC402]|uniref:MetQ/NlpA family ABC transporter substrate-binding protein n=1 Tax=Asticcacaulis sp. AC402 TaxID=1282361 RepID=UPI0003C3F2F4|nr:MetQ/NlpA family ABC transporter substrate-binding protein [Asticcacaulis sp. AC402]ESQ74962.1 methionine ABC transporter substrate-binding protein [Asticcacaulis sp. AC402]